MQKIKKLPIILSFVFAFMCCMELDIIPLGKTEVHAMAQSKAAAPKKTSSSTKKTTSTTKSKPSTTKYSRGSSAYKPIVCVRW